MPHKQFDIDSFLEKKSVLSAVIAIGAMVVLLAAFQAGVFVGIHKAAFSYRMGDNYYRAFGNPHTGMMGGNVFFEEELPNAYGAAGKILSVTLPTFTIDDRGVEKIILIENETQMRHFRDVATSSDLKPGDFAVVVGEPNEKSEIEAKLIRILPPPPETAIPGK